MSGFTHVKLTRCTYDSSMNPICYSELTVRSPVYIPENAYQYPQPELFDWVISEFPSFIPTAYLNCDEKIENE